MFEASDAARLINGRSINNLQISIAAGLDSKSPVNNNQSSEIKSQTHQFGSVSIFNKQKGTAPQPQTELAQLNKMSGKAVTDELMFKSQISSDKQPHNDEIMEVINKSALRDQSSIEDINKIGVRRSSPQIQQYIKQGAGLKSKVQSNNSISQFHPILNGKLVKANGISNDSNRLYNNSLFEETPHNQLAQLNMGSPKGSIKQRSSLTPLAGNTTNDQQQQSAGNILSIYQSPKITKRGGLHGSLTNSLTDQDHEQIVHQSNSKQINQRGGGRKEEQKGTPIGTGSPQFAQSSNNTPFKEIQYPKVHNVEMNRYQTMVILSQIAKKRSLNINVPEQIILTMKNKNVAAEYMAYQEQKISKFKLNIKTDVDSILESWLKLNLAKSQSGSYVPISISQNQIPSIEKSEHQSDTSLKSIFDFFVVTSKSRILESLRNLKLNKIKNSGFIIQRFIPQRGTESQIYRGVWNLERGLKCYLYSSNIKYNGEKEGCLNFERLANLYRDVSLMSDAEIQQTLQQQSLRASSIVMTPRSQKHLVLQNELNTRFPNLNKQFHLGLPKSSGDKQTKSPDRFIQNEMYSRVKLKMDTKRNDANNTGAATFKKVIFSIQRQINELIQCLRQDSQLRETLFGDQGATLKKITVDFIEDYNSSIDEPALLLLRISSLEAVTDAPIKQNEQYFQSPLQQQSPLAFKCNGDYCLVHKSPFIPIHIAPIIVDILRSKEKSFRVSIDTIQEDRNLLKQMLAGEDPAMFSAAPQFAGKMIELRGAQLLTKSSEFSRRSQESNLEQNNINPFTRNNLQGARTLPKNPPFFNQKQSKPSQEVEVCNLCYRVYSYLDSIRQSTEAQTIGDHSDVIPLNSPQHQHIQIRDQQTNTFQSIRESVSINDGNRGKSISEERQRTAATAQVVVRYATEQDEQYSREDLEVLLSSAQGNERRSSTKYQLQSQQQKQDFLQIINEDPNQSLLNENTIVERKEEVQPSEAINDEQFDNKKNNQTVNSLAIDTFQLIDIVPQDKATEESPKKIKKSIEEPKSSQIKASIETRDGQNPLHSFGENREDWTGNSAKKEVELLPMITSSIDGEEFQSSFRVAALIPRSPPRPFFFYQNEKEHDVGEEKISNRESLIKAQEQKKGDSIIDRKNILASQGSERLIMKQGELMKLINVGASLNTQPDMKIDRSLVELKDFAAKQPNMIKSAILTNDLKNLGEISLQDGHIHEIQRESKSSESMRNFILKDAAFRNTTQNPLIVEDSFFGHISKQDEEYLVDYVDGGNNASINSLEDKGGNNLRQQDLQLSNLSPQTNAILDNKNKDSSGQKPLLNNSFGIGNTNNNKFEVIKMSANSIAPSSLIVIEEDYMVSVSASGDNQTSSQTFTLFNKKIKPPKQPQNEQSSKKGPVVMHASFSKNQGKEQFLNLTNEHGNNNKRTDNDKVQTPIIGKSIS